MIELKLPKKQQILYDKLRAGGDVAILDLYLALGLDPERAHEKDDKSRSLAQGRVIMHVVRLNRRLAEHRLKVVPGAIKRTYCLSPLS